MSLSTQQLTRLRRARVPDAAQIQQIIRPFAERDEMLPRSLGEIYENIRDFFVITEGQGGPVIATAALHVCWSHLAEIKSLAVRADRQGAGHGRTLVEACRREAVDLELRQVFALTYQPGFFGKLGFRVVDKATLPHKVWNECLRCPKFNDCHEVAVLLELHPASADAQLTLLP